MKLLSDAVEYGLRSVVWLAQRPGELRKVREIAEGTDASPGYLIKVLQTLAKAGVLSAQRGVNGGFQLLHDPAELTVLTVIKTIDPLERIERCPLGLSSHRMELCPLHQRIDDAMAAIERSFGRTTIQDLIDDGASAQARCHALMGNVAAPMQGDHI